MSEHPGDWQFLSVAVDAKGPEASRPYADQAPALTTLVDPHNLLGGHLLAPVVPNGLLVDKDGTVAWAKIGGFSVDQPEDLAVIGAWLEGQDLPPVALETNNPLRQELQATSMRLVNVLLRDGDNEGAVVELKRALARDPESFIVRKQIWALQYPERFHPVIDFAWQATQLAQERAEEATACGPEGCPIPVSDDASGRLTKFGG